MTRNRSRDLMLSATEEMVGGIWAEHQYKIENIEGYAAAFDRVSNYMRKMIDEDFKPSKQEEEDFELAMGEMMFLDIIHRHKP